jgi:hypothetical protein
MCACIHSRNPTTRRKLDLIRAIALLYLASISICGCSAATAAADHFQKTIPDPASVVFIGDSITAIWGSGQQGPQFADHPNWVDKGRKAVRSWHGFKQTRLTYIRRLFTSLLAQTTSILVGPCNHPRPMSKRWSNWSKTTVFM